MNIQTPTITLDHQAKRINVLGTKMNLLTTQADSDGFNVTLQSGVEGIGPPPHSHDWDEAFYILEGTVNFLANGDKHQLSAGAFVQIPAGTVHAFSFANGGGKMLEITGNRSKATELFQQLSSEITTTPPDMTTVTSVFHQNQVRLHLG